MKWRIFFGVLGTVIGAGAVAALAYVFTPAFRLEPEPAFEASVAVIALLLAGQFLWWAFAPLPRRKD